MKPDSWKFVLGLLAFLSLAWAVTVLVAPERAEPIQVMVHSHE